MENYSEIMKITGRSQAVSYFKNHLRRISDPSVLKGVTLKELKHLYREIFGIDFVGQGSKVGILSRILEFVRDDERTKDLTKILDYGRRSEE